LLKIIDIAGKSELERESYLGGGIGGEGDSIFQIFFSLRPVVIKANGGGEDIPVAICMLCTHGPKKGFGLNFIPLFLFSFQDERHALTAADAQRGKAVTGITIYHGVEQLINENAAAG
jgi:hypothetical protein